MKFQEIFSDGCNGWKMGDTVEGRPKKHKMKMLICSEGETYTLDCFSRNKDGLYEADDGQRLFIPIQQGDEQ